MPNDESGVDERFMPLDEGVEYRFSVGGDVLSAVPPTDGWKATCAERPDPAGISFILDDPDDEGSHAVINLGTVIGMYDIEGEEIEVPDDPVAHRARYEPLAFDGPERVVGSLAFLD